jgi:hypothetical protein
MIPKEQMDSLAEMLGIKADVLAQAISDEQEVKLELPEGRFLTKEKEAILLDNHGKRKYDEGTSKATKDAFEGKSKEDFLSEFAKEKVSEALESAKVKPNEKVAELESSLETLRNKLNQKDSEFESLQNTVKVEKTRLEAQSYIPELPETLGLKKSEAANLLLNGIEFKEDGIYKNGNLLKDNMEKPISLEDYVNSSISERGWGKQPTGRGGGSGASGGGSGSSGKPKTIEEYEAVIKEKGLHPGSADAQAILVDAAKENPEILG